jgi:tRNA(Ile)-lysidine synthase
VSTPNPALAALESLDPVLPVGVAYSGGADSTALLLAAAQRWPGQVTALHIHHGLQAAADDFARVCDDTCARLKVPLQVLRVQAGNAAGQSPEDAARLARYAALARAATEKGLGAVLLGQHADDQVETLLLALSRGAGVPGLASMAARFERGGVLFLRPLLQIPAAALRAWLLESHGATPSAAQLEQLLSQIAACTTRGHRIHLKVATGHVTRAGAALRYEAVADKLA